MTSLLDLLKTQASIASPDLHLYTGNRPLLRNSQGELLELKDAEVLKKEDITNFLQEILTPEEQTIFSERHDYEVSKSFDGVGRFRIHVSFSLSGTEIDCRRLLTADTIPSLDELRIPEPVKDLIGLHRGLILITGPNGAGKTTTLASVIEEINKTRYVNIITLEDPIEVIFENKKSIISQRELGTHTRQLKEGIKYLFRQDVNIVVINEIRSFEEFSAAIDMAATGHLVFATMHAEDTIGAINRLIYSFPSGEQNQARILLAESLRAILSQKLLPCTEGGRIVTTEFLKNSSGIKSLIMDQKEHLIKSTMEISSREGMYTFDQSLRDLYDKGLITHDIAVAFSEQKRLYGERIT